MENVSLREFESASGHTSNYLQFEATYPASPGPSNTEFGA